VPADALKTRSRCWAPRPPGGVMWCPC